MRDTLKIMAAQIAGGIVVSHGLDTDTIADRAIQIARAISERVDALSAATIPQGAYLDEDQQAVTKKISKPPVGAGSKTTVGV